MRGERNEFTSFEIFLGKFFPFMQPDPIFRERLKQALLAEQRRRLAQEAASPTPPEGGVSWRWSLAATVPLLIGVLAYLWRRHQRPGDRLVPVSGGQ